MRRVLRWLFNGLGKALCLLSLLACLGAGWLWWRGKRAGLVRVEVAAARADVEVVSRPSGLNISATRRWPGTAGAWAGEELGAPYTLTKAAAQQDVRDLRIGAVWLVWGQLEVHLDRVGAPEREAVPGWIEADGEGFDARWSRPLPFLAAGGVPQWLAVCFFALWPLLWLAFRSRRLYARRCRRRLGLCLRCGYDLRGNTSGTCSECGTAVKTEGRVTA
jgi:hypothetical protein